MEPFQFELPTRIVWGPSADAVAREVARLGRGRILIVTDPGLVAAGLATALRESWATSDLEVNFFTGVGANPTSDQVGAAVGAFDETGSDVIVALGGGSVIDVAKAAAMVHANGGSYSDYQWEGRPIVTRSRPMIAVPTTAGTGSEVTRVAVISDPLRPLKKGVLSPLMFPHVAVLDPVLTMELPAHLTAGTGMDAVSHALEAFIGRRTGPLSDLLALESLRLALRFLERATADGSDVPARTGMLLAALYGGIAMDQAGLGLVHALSGGLCTHLHLHHGITNAAIMPAVLQFNLPEIEPRRRQLLGELFGLDADATDEAIVARLAGFVEAVGLAVGFGDRQEDFAAADWDAIAADSMRMAMIANNPRSVTLEDCAEILQALR